MLNIYSIYKTKSNSIKDLFSDVLEKLSNRIDLSNTNKLLMRFSLNNKLKGSITGQDLLLFTNYTRTFPSSIDISFDFKIEENMREDYLKLSVISLKEL